jgi:hypothetical protein
LAGVGFTVLAGAGWAFEAVTVRTVAVFEEVDFLVGAAAFFAAGREVTAFLLAGVLVIAF